MITREIAGKSLEPKYYNATLKSNRDSLKNLGLDNQQPSYLNGRRFRDLRSWKPKNKKIGL